MLDRHTEEDYLTPRLFRRACAWLDENCENAPWMLWVDSFAPHERWDPPMEFADAYCPPGKSPNYIQPQLINNRDLRDDEIERTKALYYGYVTFVDKWIGTLLDKLEQMGRLDDTAIFFTSDHGTELWDKGQFGKGGNRLYRYNTAIPLLVRLPGGQRGGTVCEDFVQHQDFLPAILKLFGVDTPEEVRPDGRDFLDESAAAPDKVITAWHGNVSVRSMAWNLVLDGTGKGERAELYDLSADPDETKNVYDAHPDVVAEHRAFLEQTCGPLPYEIAHHGDRRQAPPLSTNIREA